MNAKEKLSDNLSYIIDDSDEEHIVFNQMPYQVPPKSDTSTRDMKNVPTMNNKRFERTHAPDIRENNAPTLHSHSYTYKGPSQKEEVMLAVMDTHLNELKEGEEVLPNLRKKWVESAADILTGAPPHLPPLREINHQIPLIDESMRYCYHLPKCPDSLKPQLAEKIQHYKNAGWWEETNISQAAPMICVPKKSGKIRTIVDGRKRNENTEKDVTPFPDQEQIRMDLAQANIDQRSTCRTLMSKSE